MAIGNHTTHQPLSIHPPQRKRCHFCLGHFPCLHLEPRLSWDTFSPSSPHTLRGLPLQQSVSLSSPSIPWNCLPWVFWWNGQGHLRLSQTGIKHITSDCLVAFLFKRWVKMSFAIFLGLLSLISDGSVTQWPCSQKAWRCAVQSDSPWSCWSI